MSELSFDPSVRLDLYFRVNRAGSKTLTFTDSNGAYDITSNTFQVLFKDSFGNTILTLTQGSGITVTPTNQLAISITANQSDIPTAEYYWELNLTNVSKTWLCGKAFFHTGVFDGITESTGVTITQGDDVAVTISDGDTITVTVYETGTYEATQAQVNGGTATGVYVSPKTLAEKVEVITASGTNTYTATIPGTLTSGRRVYVKFTNANTGASTLNGTAIKKSVNTALASGDIAAGEVKLLAYDGTNFQVVGGSGSGSATPSINVEGGTERKISAMTALTATSVANGDLLPIVDVSDTTDAASGTNKKMTVAEMKKLVGRIVLHKNTNIVVGGGTSETLVYSFLIPGGTLLAGDVLEIAAVFSKTGAAGGGTCRAYFNTSAAIGGSQVITFATTANASLYNEGFRRVAFKSQSSQFVFPVAVNGVSSETAAQTTAGTALSVDFSTDKYLVFTLQRASGADSVTIESVHVEIIR